MNEDVIVAEKALLRMLQGRGSRSASLPEVKEQLGTDLKDSDLRAALWVAVSEGILRIDEQSNIHLVAS